MFYLPEGSVCAIYDCTVNHKKRKIAENAAKRLVKFGSGREIQSIPMKNLHKIFSYVCRL